MTAARTITFKLNGAQVTADVQPHHNLVELLQTQFGLTGARESCGQGLCGCCTVIVNDRAVSACLYLALVRRWRGDKDRRKPGYPRQAQSRARGLYRGQRIPMRLLHARLHHDGDASCSTSIPIRTTRPSSIISPAISAAVLHIRRCWMR